MGIEMPLDRVGLPRRNSFSGLSPRTIEPISAFRFFSISLSIRASISAVSGKCETLGAAEREGAHFLCVRTVCLDAHSPERGMQIKRPAR